MRALPAIVVVVAACGSASAPSPIPTAAPAAFLRVESLGIEIATPPDADLYEEIDWAVVTWDGPRDRCRLELAPDMRGDASRRIVGTLPVTCRVFGNGCGSCGELRPIRGGAAEERYPTEPPAIALTSAWSDRGQDRSGLFVWRDGTMQFYGAACRGYRGRRGRVPAERVAELVDALDRSGVLAHEVVRRAGRNDPQCEHAVTNFTIRSTARTKSMTWTCEADPLVAEALARIHEAVGPDPCAA